MIKVETVERIKKFVEERNWKQFHTDENLAKSIVLEATEILELFQWSSTCKNEDNLKEELADVLTYVIMFCDKHNYDMDEIINQKLDKNIKKYPINKFYGQTKKYNEI